MSQTKSNISMKVLEISLSGAFKLLLEMIKSDHPIAKPLQLLVFGFVGMVGLAIVLQTGANFIQALKM